MACPSGDNRPIRNCKHKQTKKAEHKEEELPP